MAKLVDFGLAQVLREGVEAASELTGTPDYMAPEVWSGKPPTRRSDVYSVGAVMYELIQGDPPFAQVPVGELGRVICERDAPAARYGTAESPRWWRAAWRAIRSSGSPAGRSCARRSSSSTHGVI